MEVEAMKRDTEASFAVGSVSTAIGFWGLVIDGALKYAVNEPVIAGSGPLADPDVLVFGALFAGGLIVMGLSALIGRRRMLASPPVRRP
jgi:hypothetical protein